MEFKRNNPGCRCCVDGGTGWDTGPVTDVATLQLNGTPPPEFEAFDTFDLSDITELGAGAVAVGFDIENSRFLAQRTNGEVWTIKWDRTDPQLLWSTSSDAAGYELQFVKWHPKWGFAGAQAEHLSDSGLNVIMALDANGDIIHGPYSSEDWYAPGGEQYIPACWHVDDAGNLYAAIVHDGTTVPVYIRVTEDGTEFADFVEYRYYTYQNDQIGEPFSFLESDASPRDPSEYYSVTTRTTEGTYHWIYQLYHDGQKLHYRMSTHSTAAEDAYYSTTGGTNATHIIDLEDVYGSASYPSDVVQYVAMWDDIRNFIWHGYWIYTNDLTLNMYFSDKAWSVIDFG